MCRLLCFGEVLFDVLPSGPLLGGAPANCAVHASELGISSALVSAIGSDALGDQIRAALVERGVSINGLQTVDFPTSTVDVTVTPEGIPSYIIHKNVAWDSIAFTPEIKRLARKADAICFGSLAQRSETSRNTLRRIFDVLRPDCIRFFDINLRHPRPSRDVLLSSLEHTTILKLNDEELPEVGALLGLATGDAALIAPVLFRRFPISLIVLTCGKAGATLISPDQSIAIPVHPVRRMADTVGAGDAFSAGLLASLLQGKTLEEAGQAASRRASAVCECYGAWLPLNTPTAANS